MWARTLLLLFVGACSAGRPTTEPSTPTDRTAGEARRGELVRVDTREIWIGDRSIAPVRPADAPGIVDDDLLPTYAIPELRAAVPEGTQPTIAIEPQVPVGVLRSLLVTLGGPLRITVSDQTFALAPATGASPGSALDVADDRSIAELVTIAGARARSDDAPILLAIDHAPCVDPPAGMVCVPGGRAIVGADDGTPEERPRRELVISTFYIDVHEVTTARYDACRAASACPIRLNGEQKIMRPFVGPDQPAVPLDWQRAHRVCAWEGKRLPTEWEWEKAARGPDGDVYPWGNDPPTCERAQYRECAPVGCTPRHGKTSRWDCDEHRTKNVGSYPAGHYGIHEMAGNGYEWTASAGVESIADCGDACNGTDPQGPCDGAHPCKKARVLRGGSWYWPAERLRGSHRRVEVARSGGHRLSARCASSMPWLTSFPPRVLAETRSRPATLAPPSAKRVAAFNAIEQDAIEDKPICNVSVRESWGPLQSRGGRSEQTCRDPFPYLESNEPRGWVWAPYVANLGGAYVGVGSDQNLSYAAAAASEWVWLMDYDPRVVDHNRRMIMFIRESSTPEQFIARWSPDAQAASLDLIDRSFAGSPERGRMRQGYLATHERLHEYYREQAGRHAKAPDFGWLRNPEHYRWIRTLVEQGRVAAVKGDLLGGKAMQSIGAAAREIDTVVRIYYVSNAPTSWGGQITDAYRENVLALPFDARSVVLQTTSRGGFRQSGKWHHNVQWGRHLHMRLRQPGFDTIAKVLEDRIPADHGDVTVLGLPGR